MLFAVAGKTERTAVVQTVMHGTEMAGAVNVMRVQNNSARAITMKRTTTRSRAVFTSVLGTQLDEFLPERSRQHFVGVDLEDPPIGLTHRKPLAHGFNTPLVQTLQRIQAMTFPVFLL
jgi:hypothetical protein